MDWLLRTWDIQFLYGRDVISSWKGGGAGITISSHPPRCLLYFHLQPPALTASLTSVPALTQVVLLLWLDCGPSISVSVPAHALWAIGWNPVRGLFNLHPQNNWVGASELHKVNKRVGGVGIFLRCSFSSSVIETKGRRTQWMAGLK